MSLRRSFPAGSQKNAVSETDPTGAKIQKEKDPTSAVLLRACALPGWGHFYAGRRGLGAALIGLSLTLLMIFLHALFGSAQILASQLFAYMESGPVMSKAELPLGTLGGSITALYLLWLLSFAHAADGLGQRDDLRPGLLATGLSSWLCPGVGQLLCKQRALGLVLFASYLLGMAASSTAYRELVHGSLALVKDMQGINLASAERLSDAVHGLSLGVDLSPGRLLQHVSGQVSLLMVFWALRTAFFSSAAPRRRLLAQLFVGWLAPGSGQAVDGRAGPAWIFASLYLGVLLLTAVLFKSGVVSVAGADHLDTLRTLIVLLAMLEAPARARVRQ